MHRRRMLQTLVEFKDSTLGQCRRAQRERATAEGRGGSTGLALDRWELGSTVGGAGVDREETIKFLQKATWKWVLRCCL